MLEALIVGESIIIQWNLSKNINPDTLGTEGSVLNSEMSSFRL